MGEGERRREEPEIISCPPGQKPEIISNKKGDRYPASLSSINALRLFFFFLA